MEEKRVLNIEWLQFVLQYYPVKKLQIWGKLGINSVLGLNDKQTVPDSSVYLKGECKKSGLREPTPKKISGLIFHSGRSFRQKNKTDEL